MCSDPDNCTQLCYINNTTTEEICSCQRGYQIDTDGITCNGKLIVSVWTVSYVFTLTLQMLMNAIWLILPAVKTAVTSLVALSVLVKLDILLTVMAELAMVNKLLE